MTDNIKINDKNCQYKCKGCKRQSIENAYTFYKNYHSGMITKTLHVIVRARVRNIVEVEPISAKVLSTLNRSNYKNFMQRVAIMAAIEVDDFCRK